MFGKNFSIDFMNVRRIALLLSIILVLGSISLLVFRGLNLGIDFRGGISFKFSYQYQQMFPR